MQERENDFIPVSQAAQEFNISSQSIYNWIYKNKLRIKYISVFKGLRVSRKSVSDYISQKMRINIERENKQR